MKPACLSKTAMTNQWKPEIFQNLLNRERIFDFQKPIKLKSKGRMMVY